MKHKTWFRLVLRAIGVLLIGIALPEFGGLSLGLAASLIFEDGLLGYDSWEMYAYSMPSYGFQLAIGLYLLFGGEWIVNRVIPSNCPYCPHCGYNLSHHTGERCSECGVTLPPREPAHVSSPQEKP
jgi:hypothetical protein